MNPMGNPLAALAGLSGLAGMSGVLNDLAKAPITKWSQAGLLHKVIAAGAGAGLAYYLHTRGMADTAVAVAGVGGAYVTSMVLHYPSIARQTAGAPANGAGVQALPPAQVAAMNGIAQQMMGQGLAGVPQNVSQGRYVAQPQRQAIPRSGGSKWDLLSMEL